jgi:NADH:ubiquinone oxidoreductase subunit B-like Fe-S oxidoreductase
MTESTQLGYDSKVENNIILTTVESAVNWMRKNSLWPMPMGLACCAIELWLLHLLVTIFPVSARKLCASLLVNLIFLLLLEQ